MRAKQAQDILPNALYSLLSFSKCISLGIFWIFCTKFGRCFFVELQFVYEILSDSATLV